MYVNVSNYIFTACYRPLGINFANCVFVLFSNALLPSGSFSLASHAGSTSSATVCYYTEHQH